ncbi:MIP/aquaporin family protein [Tomitella cavernea]|uniref:Aquaporin n=1 Tax=Tomitella cavernea TaxID=1387982 RepID=A0ABP9C5V3_9ACTN|nr:aquaporin [Tomitella cavernea]
MDPRKLLAEALGTALLVFVGVGVATLSFGFGLTGQSPAAGIVATALAFGLIMLIMAYAIGPISGAHINPAVTLGFVVSGRMRITEAVAYWVAQIAGGIIGAGVLRGIFATTDFYSTDKVGLGTNGWGEGVSFIGVDWVGAFFIEIVLTFIFVSVVLAVTTKVGSTAASGAAIGLALATVHLVGVAVTGTSVNPARSIGPAIFVGGDALNQLWLFIVAPLIGGALAAVVVWFLYSSKPLDVGEDLIEQDVVEGPAGGGA